MLNCERPKLNLTLISTELKAKIVSSVRKVGRGAIIVIGAALEWSRLTVIRQIKSNTNWLQEQLFYASVWLEDGSSSRRLVEKWNH
jgi:hypothetical protein